MSKLSKLIAELCPEGVEWKKLGEVCEIVSKIKWSDTDNDAKYVYVDLSSVDIKSHQISNDYIIDKDTAPSRAQQIIRTDDVLFGTTRPTLMRYCLVPKTLDGQICSTGYCVIRSKKELVLARWIYHMISSNGFAAFVNERQQGAGYPSISDKVLFSFEIPVPPLPVQEEIVRILDMFTTLEAELEAELDCRKRQYEFYRNQLLSFEGERSEGVKWMKLGGAIISLKTGLNPRKNFVLNEDGSDKPYITGKDIFNNRINVTEKTDLINDETVRLINKRACLESGLLLFASTGTGTVGRMAVIGQYNNDWAMSETLYAIKTKEVLNPKFLMHCLYSECVKSQFETKISKGSVPHLKVVDLLNVQVPVPPLSEQHRIVSILDRFEALTTDLQSGLPAEIEARRKQYEYYREQLLTFKRKSA